MRTLSFVLISLGLCVGCNIGKGGVDGDGSGPDKDARMISDVFTWDCVDQVTGELYQGAFGQTVTLEYAPDSLQSLTLPGPGGCSAATTMFPVDAGSGGAEIPDLDDEPEWETDADEGTLRYGTPGFWRDDVFPDVRTCQRITDVLGGGTRLINAGDLTGITTPAPATIPVVEFSGMSADPTTGVESIVWGDAVEASWDDHDWDEVWIQIRREREGDVWESVTCNATGQDSFTMDDDIWGLMDENLQVEQNQLYVAFQRGDTQETGDELKVEAFTRALAIAIVAND
jgi:hypothetical protein